MPGRRQAVHLALLMTITALAVGVGAATGSAPLASGCPTVAVDERQAATLRRALSARQDVLGESLLARPAGPTYGAVRRLIPPLHYAVGRGRRPLTTSGAYYLPFSLPYTPYGGTQFALHVADGSEILQRRAGGEGMRLLVGNGDERYGSCVARLEAPRLAEGFLPILRTAYTDANGTRYRQESFASRVPGVPSLVSFVRLEVDATTSRTGEATVRLVPFGASGAAERATATTAGAHLLHDPSATAGRGGARSHVRGRADVYAGWIQRPEAGSVVMDAATYEAALRYATRFWERQLERGVVFDVPEPRVLDAQRNLLIQQLAFTWRYSIGNPYEELSFAEATDAARVTARYGLAETSTATLRHALRQLPHRFTSWRAGAVLLAVAERTTLLGDDWLREPDEAALRAALHRLERQIRDPDGAGLLDPEPFSSDIGRPVVSLHSHAVVWQGLLAMSRVWARTGDSRLAWRARAAALRLERAVRRAIAASARQLPDGSLFLPAALLEDSAPFGRLIETRAGSYWNLVMPYALASGLFPPEGRQARGLVRYLERHGSRFLGLVRAGAYRVGGGTVGGSGIDQVYGLNVSRTLADLDRPAELVLSLYGTLAGALTPDTFVGGEAATVLPSPDRPYRSMYLPPNGGTNTAFLETLRVMLVHEARDDSGKPIALQLAFATPRSWLRDGQEIRVREAPTSFGRVSYAIERRGSRVAITVETPRVPQASLRLRLPAGTRIAAVVCEGRQVPFDRSTGTIDLGGRTRGELVARLSAG
jgi:hypothetical protein